MKILIMIFISLPFLQTATMPEFNVSADYGITIDMDQPLSEYYQFDYKKIGWSSEHASTAAQIFDDKSDIVVFSMDEENEKVMMQLKLDAPEVSDWTITEWDQYLRTMK